MVARSNPWAEDNHRFLLDDRLDAPAYLRRRDRLADASFSSRSAEQSDQVGRYSFLEPVPA